MLNFVENFFKSIGCEIDKKKEFIEIKNVNNEFEKIYGKKAPYKFFISEIENKKADNFLFRAISLYLENIGQTSLIKLNFDRDYKKEFEHYLKLKNCEIYNVSKKVNYKTIVRFTFKTTLQYLNERDSLVNSIYVKDGGIIYFDIDKYSQIEGKKEEISKMDFKKELDLAKSNLKSLTENKINEIASYLEKRLEKEKERINEHFCSQKNEIDLKIKRLKENLQILERQNKNEQNEQKISKFKKEIYELENSEILKKIEEEKIFFLNDENSKHSLNVANKLINTTIIYYPCFEFNLFLKSKDASRQININFEPVEDKISDIMCENCKREIKEIYLCSSGHINCNNCLGICKGCSKLVCASCIMKECDYCGRKLCKNCISKCSNCLKPVCQIHLRENYANQKECCPNCLKQCPICLKFALKNSFKMNSEGKQICEKCIRLSSFRLR